MRDNPLVRSSRAGVPGLMAEECVAGSCARRSFDESRQPVDHVAAALRRIDSGQAALRIA